MFCADHFCISIEIFLTSSYFNVRAVCISISRHIMSAHNAMLCHSNREKTKKVIFRSTKYLRKQHFINIITKKQVIRLPQKTNFKPKVTPYIYMHLYAYIWRDMCACTPVWERFPRSTAEGLERLLPSPPPAVLQGLM